MGVIIIGIIVIGVLWFLLDQKIRMREMREGYDIQPYKVHSKVIYLSSRDKELWDKMSRKQKRFYLNKQDTMIKSGELVRIKDKEGTLMGLVTREEYNKRKDDISK